jgi:mycothiol maleylpyruvate isomerase-like protein
MSMDEITLAFLEAADTFAGLLELPEVATRWDEASAIESYTVGALVGHVNVAMRPLETALDKPAPSDLKVIRLGRYYAGMRIDTPDDAQKAVHGGVRDLSNETGREGPEANAASFHALVERVRKQLAGGQGGRLVDLRPIVPIAVRLDDFLRTRVMELVVHADDLAVSVGVDPPQPSQAAATGAIDTLMATARATHGDLPVIRALARRERSTAVFPVF